MAFVDLIVIAFALYPLAAQRDPLVPSPATVELAAWILRLAVAGFGAVLVSGAARSRGLTALVALVIGAVLAALVSFFPVAHPPLWLQSVAANSRLMGTVVALRTVGLVCLGAMAYELVRWRPG